MPGCPTRLVSSTGPISLAWRVLDGRLEVLEVVRSRDLEQVLPHDREPKRGGDVFVPLRVGPKPPTADRYAPETQLPPDKRVRRQRQDRGPERPAGDQRTAARGERDEI